MYCGDYQDKGWLDFSFLLLFDVFVSKAKGSYRTKLRWQVAKLKTIVLSNSGMGSGWANSF